MYSTIFRIMFNFMFEFSSFFKVNFPHVGENFSNFALKVYGKNFVIKSKVTLDFVAF